MKSGEEWQIFWFNIALFCARPSICPDTACLKPRWGYCPRRIPKQKRKRQGVWERLDSCWTYPLTGRISRERCNLFRCYVARQLNATSSNLLPTLFLLLPHVQCCLHAGSCCHGELANALLCCYSCGCWTRKRRCRCSKRWLATGGSWSGSDVAGTNIYSSARPLNCTHYS